MSAFDKATGGRSYQLQRPSRSAEDGVPAKKEPERGEAKAQPHAAGPCHPICRWAAGVDRQLSRISGTFVEAAMDAHRNPVPEGVIIECPERPDSRAQPRVWHAVAISLSFSSLVSFATAKGQTREDPTAKESKPRACELSAPGMRPVQAKDVNPFFTKALNGHDI